MNRHSSFAPLRLYIIGLVVLVQGASGCSSPGKHLGFPQPREGDWPTVRASDDNRGRANAGSVSVDTLLWQRKTGGEAAGEPTVWGGLIYFPGQDRRLEVYAVTDGDRVYRQRFDGPVTGALPDDSSVCFLTDQDERKMFIYGYGSGGRRDSYDVPRSRVAPRRLTDSTLCVAGLNGLVVSFNDEGYDVWTAETDGPILATPALQGSVLYVTSGKTLSAFDAQTGQRIWYHRASGAIQGAPSTDNENIYFGTYDSLVFALDLKEGGMKWFASVGGGMVTTPAVGEMFIYASVNDGLVYALNKSDGHRQWTFDTRAVANLSPTLAGDVLYIASKAGFLFALNASTGELISELLLKGSAMTPPIVAEGRVFVADSKRRLHCFGPRESAEIAKDGD